MSENKRGIILDIQNLSAAYGGIAALKGVSMHINEGEIVAALGANGAGKSTLLKCISGLEKPAQGTITFKGVPIPKKSYMFAALGLVHVPEGRQIFTHLSVYENLLTGAYCRPKNKKEIHDDIEKVYSLFPRLKERAKQYGGHLSGGEQQMLAISRGIMAHPKLMMLDEPSLGLAPIIVDQLFDIIKEINKSGTTILLVEQNALKALTISTRAYILLTGNVAKTGKREDLLKDESLISAYL
ncbi:MAG: ABC transporter ATP-binding protein [Termitinemataceae bacterium]|nr:MAG: ABC transporter ATP-binding protein [Termitinemataceae bacterium]